MLGLASSRVAVAGDVHSLPGSLAGAAAVVVAAAAVAVAVVVAVAVAPGVGGCAVRDYVVGFGVSIGWIGRAEERCFVGAVGQLTVVAAVAVAGAASDVTSAREV